MQVKESWAIEKKEYALPHRGDVVFKCEDSHRMRCSHTIYEPLN